MNKLGIMVNDLGAAQLSYMLIRQVNGLHNDPENGVDVTVFYQHMQLQTLPHLFVAMQIAEAWSQPTPMVATSLSTAHKLLRLPCPTMKMWYVWDLEWMRNVNRQYAHYAAILHNPEFTIIARNQFHKAALENNFNREVKYTVDDFDMKQMLKVVNNVEQSRQIGEVSSDGVRGERSFLGGYRQGTRHVPEQATEIREEGGYCLTGQECGPSACPCSG